MYLDHFGFSEKPFNITPNPRFIFLSKNHKEVFAHLLYGIRQHAGFIELTGEVGTGKTTILRTLLAQLEQEAYRLAFIFNPSLSAPELLRSINQEFGIPSQGKAGSELLASLNAFLLAENAAGRTVLLVIDEAQNLSPEVLEQIRLLSNLETETDKLIQIVLVGQPELGHTLENPALRQLSQRITVRYHLRPMDFADTTAYIEHRLRVAGGKPSLFTAAAVRKIFTRTSGYPRLINIVCDRALLVGYSEGVQEIAPAQIATALRELRREARESGRFKRLWPLAAACALVLGIGGGFVLKSYSPSAVRPPPAAPSQTASSPSPQPLVPRQNAEPPADSPQAPSPSRMEELRRTIADLHPGRSAAEGFNALAHLWNGRPVRYGGTVVVPGELIDVAARRDLQVALYEGDFDDLLRLDQPALLEIDAAGRGAKRYLALVAVREGKAFVSPSPGGRGIVSLDELKGVWTGRAYLLWRNYLNFPETTDDGARGGRVALLQDLLREMGFYEEKPSGIYDAATKEAVMRLQEARGFAADGRFGPQMLMILYQDSARFSAPKISGRSMGGES